MNLWLLTSELPGPRNGGIGRYVDSFARAWVAAGHRCTVFYPGENDEVVESSDGYRQVQFDDGETERAKGVNLPEHKTLPADEHPAFPHNIVSYDHAVSWRLAEVLGHHAKAEGLPDVIEVQEYKALAYFLLLRQRVEPGYLEGVPVVVHAHTPDFIVQQVNQEPRFRFPDWWVGELERFCFLAANAVLSPSQFLADRLPPWFEEGDFPITVYPLPLPEVPASPEVTPEPRHLLFAGRIETRKGVIELVDACARLWAAGEDFRLSLAGNACAYAPKEMPLDHWLIKRHQRWVEAGRLSFLGPVPFDTLARLRESAHAVLIPSLFENFPYVCVEAMTQGSLVVASTAGGQAEMLRCPDGSEAGILYDPEEEGALENALKKALVMPLEERQAIGNKACERIHELCDPVKVMALREAHFRRVIEAYQPATHFPFINARPRKGASTPVPAGLEGEKGLVSIIIPYYNLGEFLPEALESALATEGVDFEVLIVNDGSTDEASLKVLAEIRARGDERIRILDFPNEGLSRTRNRGAEAARGEFLLFLDADDAIEPTFAQRAKWVLDRYANVHWCYSWVRYTGEGWGVFATFPTHLPYILGHNQLVPLVLVRRASFLAFGQNKKLMRYGLEDWESWIAMMAEGMGGVSIPDLLTLYRVRADSMYQTGGRNQLVYLFELITREHPELFAQYGADLYNLQNADGPAFLWDHPAGWSSPLDKTLSLQQLAERVVNVDLPWHQKEFIYLKGLLKDEKARTAAAELRQAQEEAKATEAETRCRELETARQAAEKKREAAELSSQEERQAREQAETALAQAEKVLKKLAAKDTERAQAEEPPAKAKKTLGSKWLGGLFGGSRRP